MLHPMRLGTYTITSGYGFRNGVLHRGVDYAAPSGTPIYAAETGVVVDSRTGVGGFGAWIVIDHMIDGRKVSTVYGHMYGNDLLVSKGQNVTAGQLISRVGNNGDSSGPHLHFEVWLGGRFTGGTALNPTTWTKGNPVAPPAPPAPTVLKLGSTGLLVTKLQNFMTSYFPSYNQYTPSGYFGVQTEAGIKEFQRRVGVPMTGAVDEATQAKLKTFGFTL